MTSTLSQQIAQFYDTSSELWEKIWGEHMHHGYYGRAGNYKINRRQAQIDLIEELLIWANIKTVDNLLDVGCGIGGSTLYLAEKFNATATGITLSPVQANRATERAHEVKLDEKVQFRVTDALNMPFPDNQFDLVWSLESGEHMPDKHQFFRECYRVLKPGGTFICATWCHRPTNSWAGELTPDEKRHLQEIYRVYCLPYVISLPEYETIARDCGLNNIRVDDWSLAVAPFWQVVIDSALDLPAIVGLLNSGRTTLEGALSLGLMRHGYERGLIRFGLLCGQK
ncbi:methyltransferase domain-containing protein [Crocosphaera sp. UHCC 0190]|uniref:methyltransferase domain-containing protein n=1 Tax=Crocosphaera sp. UHCC 0190 TaxID=3110246 RepID=UPI002B202581|nr:methyltransferase domain-containing protein [Crocosphaera sp. UHCC 0190]MEA5509882.1 methyltransferase domain-containing protein [Crocosphaera sp. UHCC 0190]